MIGIWIPGVSWQRLTLATGEVVDLQVTSDDGNVVRGLALDPTGWPLERLWEIEAKLITARDLLQVSPADGLLEPMPFGDAQPQ